MDKNSSNRNFQSTFSPLSRVPQKWTLRAASLLYLGLNSNETRTWYSPGKIKRDLKMNFLCFSGMSGAAMLSPWGAHSVSKQQHRLTWQYRSMVSFSKAVWTEPPGCVLKATRGCSVHQDNPFQKGLQDAFQPLPLTCYFTFFQALSEHRN